MLLSIFLIVIGFILLIKGADYLVSGASSVAKKSGIPPIVIGLTIVAFGTSMPELVVNLLSAINGSTDLAVSNILGSNLSNILLILGATAIITPITVQRSTTYKEIPFALLAVLVTGILANDIFIDGGVSNIISRGDGLIHLLFFIIFLYYTYSISKGNISEMEDIQTYRTYVSTAMILGGLVGLFIGGKFVVDGAVTFAQMLGISDRVIGLTVVAIGTSLPELVTSIIAALKRQTDIVIGNIVGSNIFNIFWILGVTATISPLPFSAGLNIDVMMNIIVGVILLLAIFLGTRHQIAKWEGIIFLTIYMGYLGSLIFIQ